MSTNNHWGVAGADLTASQNLAVAPDSGDGYRFKVSASATDIRVGVLQNAPKDDGDAHVQFDGLTNATAGGVIVPYADITNGTGGKFVAAATNDRIRGVYIPDGSNADGTPRSAAANDRITILLSANQALMP